VALTRSRIRITRGHNEVTRRNNRARCHEIDIRQWRNNMRKTLLLLKGRPSTSPWCGWVNDPIEDEWITAEWLPPRPSPREPGDDIPPF
jgi:hypothetical protein